MISGGDLSLHYTLPCYVCYIAISTHTHKRTKHPNKKTEINSLKNRRQTDIKTDLFLRFRSATRLILLPRKTGFFFSTEKSMYIFLAVEPTPRLRLCCTKASYEDVVWTVWYRQKWNCPVMGWAKQGAQPTGCPPRQGAWVLGTSGGEDGVGSYHLLGHSSVVGELDTEHASWKPAGHQSILALKYYRCNSENGVS